MWDNVKAKGGWGGPTSKKYGCWNVLYLARSRAGCNKPHQKVLFLAEVLNFLNLAHNIITIRMQTSNRDISKQLKEKKLKKPCMVEVPNFVVMFLLWVSTIHLSLFEKKVDFYGQKCMHASLILASNLGFKSWKFIFWKLAVRGICVWCEAPAGSRGGAPCGGEGGGSLP